jgi:hypothetical protein
LPAPPAGTEPGPEKLTANPELLPQSADPPAFLPAVPVPDVESQWTRKAFERGCLVGALFFFGTTLLAIIDGLRTGTLDRHHFGGDPIGTVLLLVLGPIAIGPLFGLGCACLAFVLEMLFKTTWWKPRRKAPGAIVPGSNRRFFPSSDKDAGKSEITRGQTAPPDDAGLRDGGDGLCPPPGNGAGQG